MKLCLPTALTNYLVLIGGVGVFCWLRCRNGNEMRSTPAIVEEQSTGTTLRTPNPPAANAREQIWRSLFHDEPKSVSNHKFEKALKRRINSATDLPADVTIDGWRWAVELVALMVKIGLVRDCCRRWAMTQASLLGWPVLLVKRNLWPLMRVKRRRSMERNTMRQMY